MELSASNARIKELRRLSGRRSSRVDAGAFVIEGMVLVREALAAGVAITTIYVDAAAGSLVAELDETAPDVEVRTVAAGALRSVLPAVSPQPVAAVAVAGIARELSSVVAGAIAARRPLLVLVDLSDPGNVGTLLRAAESSGCGGVVLAGDGVDLYNPKVVRASAGSMFRVPVSVVSDVDDVLHTLSGLGVATFAAVARGGVPHLEAPLDGCASIVLGNEAHGLPDRVVAECVGAVTIAMDGPAESLNVAMAGTVLCFEALRQRATVSRPPA